MMKFTSLIFVVCLSVASFAVAVPWIDARDYHAGGYNDYDDAAITAALSAAGSSERTVLLAAGLWKISNSLTIPSNITLKFEHGAILNISTATTVTINGPIEASVSQIFLGAGKVNFGSKVKEAYPQWWGAIGTADDTVVCQATLDSGVKTIRFKPAIYSIYPVKKYIIGFWGLQPASDTVLIFEPGSKLKAITNDRDHYSVLQLEGKHNVRIYGVTIEGERSTHTGTTGEWGHGIAIHGASTNIVIKDANVFNCWGDGIEVSGASDGVYVENSTFDNNRRNACSITNAKNVLFTKCTFSNSHGTSPQAGVDVEADTAADYIQNIVFEDCRSYNNVSTGFGVAKDGGLDNPISVTFRGCISDGDGGGFGIAQGPSDTNGGRVFITDCYSKNAKTTGFSCGWANLPVTINGLYIINPNQDNLDESWARYASGVVIWMGDDNRLAGNITARNVHVESTDGKAVKALCLHHFSSAPNSGIENIDIELTTNLPNHKRMFKADSAGSFLGYCRVRFPDDPMYVTTSSLSAADAAKYIGQTITNKGATYDITVFLNAPASVSNGSEFTFVVKSAYRITLNMTGYPLVPGNKTSYYSSTIGDRLKVRSDGTNWYIAEKIGTWQ